MKTLKYILPALLCLTVSGRLWAGTLSIESIKIHSSASNLNEGPYTVINARPVIDPQLEVTLKTSKALKNNNLFVHAYFYDASSNLIKAYDSPVISFYKNAAGVTTNRRIYPVVFLADTPEKVFFRLPPNLPSDAKVVVVFGSKLVATAQAVPEGSDRSCDYADKALVQTTAFGPEPEDHSNDMPTPVIEKQVTTANPLYPRFTLFLHLPHGISNPRDVKGVFAECMLANSAEEIRDKLNGIQNENDPNPDFAFAEAHQMAILAWGGKRAEATTANYDQMSKEELWKSEDSFEELAAAWDRGVQGLIEEQGIPNHDYLLSGWSAGGEWAGRLALHKPERFLAVHVHVPTKYEPPNEAGSRILWLVTSGELDANDLRARRFFVAAKAANYPILFKSFVALGHEDSDQAVSMGCLFFEYAWALKTEAATAGQLALNLSAFRSPPFYGDVLNQDMFPATEKKRRPAPLMVALPTKELAEAWKQ